MSRITSQFHAFLDVSPYVWNSLTINVCQTPHLLLRSPPTNSSQDPSAAEIFPLKKDCSLFYSRHQHGPEHLLLPGCNTTSAHHTDLTVPHRRHVGFATACNWRRINLHMLNQQLADLELTRVCDTWHLKKIYTKETKSHKKQTRNPPHK